jgi:outer membrane protein assembly factor BamE (lipoprotein component of BamABCDE complex)
MRMHLTLISLTLFLGAPAFAAQEPVPAAAPIKAENNAAYIALKTVKIGDSKEQVLKKAGQPISQSPRTATEQETWEYAKGHLTVWIRFQGDLVVSVDTREI